jgi:hypothetical protein
MTRQYAKEILAIKAAVRLRDGHRCTKCGMTTAEHLERYGKILDVHRTTPGAIYAAGDCVTLCRACHAWEPKSRRGHRAEPLVVLRMPRSVVRRIRRLCAHFELDPADYIVAAVGPILDAEEVLTLRLRP